MTNSWPSLVSAPPASNGATGPAISYSPAPSAGAVSSIPKAPSDNAAASTKPAAVPVDNTPVNPADEASVIAKLDRLGYTYFNSYETEPDGGATIRALERSSGALLTIHLDHGGHVSFDPGWKQ
jgi:hypothetical protein